MTNSATTNKKKKPIQAKPKTLAEVFLSAEAPLDMVEELITASLANNGRYIIARCGKSKQVFELVWERPHGTHQERLTLRRCDEVPRELEREFYSIR